MSTGVEEIKKHVRFYIFVGTALLVLTIVTVLVSYHHFGSHDSNVGNITVALVIAVLKASLVVAIFMHLMWDMLIKMKVIFKVLLITGVFFAGLMTLTLWSFHDEVGPKQVQRAQKNVP